jgi:hypothetical protein
MALHEGALLDCESRCLDDIRRERDMNKYSQNAVYMFAFVVVAVAAPEWWKLLCLVPITFIEFQG